MSKRSITLSAIAAVFTAFIVVCLQLFSAKPVLSEIAETQPDQPAQIATAAAPPSLVAAKLGGKPVYVLYVTRTSDTVLVRCYPGYQPTLTVRTAGSEPGITPGKEGVLTCKAPA
jgi:hypothetical protein